MAAKLLARHGRKHLEIGARSTAPQQRECKNASHHLGTERPARWLAAICAATDWQH